MTQWQRASRNVCVVLVPDSRAVMTQHDNDDTFPLSRSLLTIVDATRTSNLKGGKAAEPESLRVKFMKV